MPWVAQRMNGKPPGGTRLAQVTAIHTYRLLIIGATMLDGLSTRLLVAAARMMAGPWSERAGAPTSGRRPPSYGFAPSCIFSWSFAAPSRVVLLAALVSASTHLGAARTCVCGLMQTALTLSYLTNVTDLWITVARSTARTLERQAPALAVLAARRRMPTRPPRGILWPG